WQVFNTLGAKEIRLAGPAAFMPPPNEFAGARRISNVDQAVTGADVIMALRIQRERMSTADIPDHGEYCRQYGITDARLAKANKDAIVMHPGPMNRDVEITSEVADGPQSVIQQQVMNGVAVRMAVLATIAHNVQARNVQTRKHS